MTTTLVGVKVEFDFDASVLKFDKAENSAFAFIIPETTGANLATCFFLLFFLPSVQFRCNSSSICPYANRYFESLQNNNFLGDRSDE